MLRAGCFKGVDFAFTWHPFSQSGVWNKSLTNIKVIYCFTGKSSHASADPQNGRSALDACELMNVWVNYLREHVPTDTRMHYAYLNSGGTAPNIVPAHAELLYALRAGTSKDLEQLLTLHFHQRYFPLICVHRVCQKPAQPQNGCAGFSLSFSLPILASPNGLLSRYTKLCSSSDTSCCISALEVTFLAASTTCFFSSSSIFA